MKRLLAWLLLTTTLLGLCGCSPAVAPTEAAETITGTTAANAPADDTPAEAPVLEGSLFLKVSSITFSVVGESDDIYLGLIPRELVTWESENPDVVSVENGVLTATGVGSTTIRGTYHDRQVECAAACLAETEEDLHRLDPEILASPKRLPPEVNLEETCTYFDNAAIVGDSITYFLFQWESKSDYLGEMLFLARGGVSMNGFVQRSKNIYYKGREISLEKAIDRSKVDRVYFLMGSNDISSATQRPHLEENWEIMLERIRKKSPDVELVLLSNIPLYLDEQESDMERFLTHNRRIAEYNLWLKEFAEENDCLYLDLYYYVQDHCGRMPKIYNQGSYHMNETGCVNWMKILRYYAQYELEGGTLS